MVVDRLVDPRALGASFVAAVYIVVLVTLGGPVSPALAASSACGAPGADGPQPALGGTVNTYFPGTSSSVAVGGTSLTVGASIGASTPIAPGDKLLILQMQSAVVDSTNTDAYGDGVVGEPPTGATSWASAGTYELATAANSVSTTGGTLQLSAGVLNAYSSSAATATMGQQTFQVVRVPRYSSATLGSNVTATPWNGAAGGIVAFDVTGTLDLNGFRIDVSASGFRGGAARQLGGGAGGASTDVRTPASNAFNGGKAEGAAGTPRYVFDGAAVVDTGVEGYPNGSSARGAPANAGGGGTDGNPAANDQNSGGGGGGNGGAGGQGGNTWSSNLASGGAGGAAVPAPSTTRLVLGGGGGGGTRNNAGPSSGGRGAGLVLLDVGSLAGTGEIRANGADGETAANDGGGGGGSGGTVVVTSAGGALSGLTVNANGGKGGDAWPTQPPGGFPGERHGPGGGGGGGVVLVSATGATTSTSGGAHGNTTTANDAYNATDGSGGSASTFTGPLPGAGSGSSCPAPQPPAAPRADLSLTKTAALGDRQERRPDQLHPRRPQRRPRYGPTRDPHRHVADRAHVRVRGGRRLDMQQRRHRDHVHPCTARVGRNLDRDAGRHRGTNRRDSRTVRPSERHERSEHRKRCRIGRRPGSRQERADQSDQSDHTASPAGRSQGRSETRSLDGVVRPSDTLRGQDGQHRQVRRQRRDHMHHDPSGCKRSQGARRRSQPTAATAGVRRPSRRDVR